MNPFAGLFAANQAPLYFGALLAVVVVLAVSRRLLLLFFALALPATLAHELMHLAFGWLSNGRPSGFSLLPRRKGRGYVLGSVTCNNVRWYNGLFIGLAPLALLPFAALLFRWRSQSLIGFDFTEAGWVYATACLTLAALPSWQDLKVALASSWLLLLVALAITLWQLKLLPFPL